MDAGSSVKEAIKNVVEKKLMGTWKLAVLPLQESDHIYFVKNSGEFIVGQTDKSIVVCTEEGIFKDGNLKCK